jgi:uncharacterized protein YbbC (DUF1343 family)
MRRFYTSLFFALFCLSFLSAATQKIYLGIDRLFEPQFVEHIKNKQVGLITNHTGVTRELVPTLNILFQKQKEHGYSLKALFAPEHGLYGEGYAGEHMQSAKTKEGIPVYSLHGATRRPTKEMLEGLDVLVFDIQDIGSRSYTFISTLFYAMEEAAKYGIKVVVLDRPNPIGGLICDGPMLDQKVRSFVGYINVPYCHGMTAGELASFFNTEYKVGCDLSVVPMKGWKRAMCFENTGLSWIPTSPNIPEATTCFHYPTTGFIGELGLCHIGVGYTLPFKVVAAPWISAEKLAAHLNGIKLPGVRFNPIRLRPFFGKYATKSCQGVMIVITDPRAFFPVTTQYFILATLKKLYPKEIAQAMKSATATQKELFVKVTGTPKILELLQKTKPSVQEMRLIGDEMRKKFMQTRKKYLIEMYNT